MQFIEGEETLKSRKDTKWTEKGCNKSQISAPNDSRQEPVWKRLKAINKQIKFPWNLRSCKESLEKKRLEKKRLEKKRLEKKRLEKIQSYSYSHSRFSLRKEPKAMERETNVSLTNKEHRSSSFRPVEPRSFSILPHITHRPILYPQWRFRPPFTVASFYNNKCCASPYAFQESQPSRYGRKSFSFLLRLVLCFCE